MNAREPVVAVVGATGAVGVEIVRCLEQRKFPLAKLMLLSSARSAGKTMTFRGVTLTVEELTEQSFDGVNLALFSACGSTSRKFSPSCLTRGAAYAINLSPRSHDSSA